MINNEDGTLTMTADELRISLYIQADNTIAQIIMGKETVSMKSVVILLEADGNITQSQIGKPENIIPTISGTLIRNVQEHTTLDFDKFVELMRIGWELAKKEECQRGNADTLH